MTMASAVMMHIALAAVGRNLIAVTAGMAQLLRFLDVKAPEGFGRMRNRPARQRERAKKEGEHHRQAANWFPPAAPAPAINMGCSSQHLRAFDFPYRLTDEWAYAP